MIERLLKIVAPHPCLECGKLGNMLCECCAYNIDNEPFYGCMVCFLPTSSGVCPQHTVDVEASWIVGWRRETLERLINAYKFERKQNASYTLASLLSRRIPQLPADTVVVPVPTRPAHVRQRGYDHSLLLARRFSALRGLEVSGAIATRAKRAQHFSDKKQRLDQAQQAFYPTGPFDPTRPHLIIDDIVTTGATVSGMTDILRQAGVQTIWLGALARQPLDE